MSGASFRNLLDDALAPEPFLRRGLALLEAQLRELALLALADWERVELVQPELFTAVAGLQRPSWGSWNGVLTALRSARKAALHRATAVQREKVEQASVLTAILDLLEEPMPAALQEELNPLAEVANTRWPRKPTLGHVFGQPIALRNLVAHTAPADPHWWERAAAALRPLLVYHADRQLTPPNATFLPPWFLTFGESDERWAFAGLRGDEAVYACASGAAPRHDTGAVPALLHAFKRLFGKQDVQEENLKKLLTRLAPEELRGVLLGDYLVGRPLQQGGYATVHLATQLSTGRKVVLKILHEGMSADTRVRFQQEAAFLSRFNHPHIVQVLGFGEDAWTPPRLIDLSDEAWYQEWSRGGPIRSYIALEWIDGPTLEELYQQRQDRPLKTAELTVWFGQAANALTTVHATGLVHRDVKPSNLMVTSTGVLKLMDFGVTRLQQEDRTLKTTPGRVLGTPAYMSPEQLRAGSQETEVGPRSDIYSLCASFYELYTGTRLFAHDTETAHDVETRKLAGELPDRPVRRARGLPSEIDTILLVGLDPEPAQRYATAADLERDLRHVVRSEPIERRPPSWVRRFTLWYRRSPGFATALLMLGALASLTTIAALVAVKVYETMAGNERDARGKAEESETKEKDAQAIPG